MTDSSGQSPADQPPAAPATGIPRALFLLLLLPCAGSALATLMPDHAPALQVVTERPALVFESYLADTSQFEAESRPVITEEFFFRNQGQNPVEIAELKPSCGCLAPTATPRIIAPGETGRITLPVRTANEPSGLREYLVTVRYLDPNPREVTLTCRMLLPQKKLLIEPRVVMVMGQPAPTAVHEVAISDFREGRPQQPIQIARIEATPAFVQASLAVQSTGEELSQTRLNIRFDGTQPPGQHRGLVAVFTNDPDYPVIQIPVVVGSRIISSPGSAGTAPVEAPRARSAPEMGRVVINRNVLSESGAADLQITAPANWQTGAVEAWPPQLNATYVPAKVTDNSSTTTENTDPQTQKLSLRVGVTELPPAGLNQGVLTLHFTTPDGPRMLTVPMSLIWL